MNNSPSHPATFFTEDECVDINIVGKPLKDKTYTHVDVDNLDEDPPIRGQEYCLFSFMSPEGLMNCNTRAVKFRGAYSSEKKALARAKELEKTDKYFKIFIGETGRWLEFDPPDDRVEKELSSDANYQQIIDSKQRTSKINELAGKYKNNFDKQENGKNERMMETKKAGAVQALNSSETVQSPPPVVEKKLNDSESRAQKMRDRLRKQLDSKKNDCDKNIEEIRKFIG